MVKVLKIAIEVAAIAVIFIGIVVYLVGFMAAISF